MAFDKTWLEVFIEQNGDSNDYNDSDDVLGWLSATLIGDALTITYDSGPDHSEVTEHYRVVRTDHG